jgi:hypothetical protein
MIISASRRTDIPAFFGEWFMQCIREGFVDVKNPFNPSQVRRFSLQPSEVDCLVFWTKNPGPFMKYLSLLKNYTYYFLFTLTPYGHDLETNLPSKEKIKETFIQLSQLIGKERIIWRYDPILLSSTIDIKYHKQNFQQLCEALHLYTNKCVISYINLYRKCLKKLNSVNIRTFDADESAELTPALYKIASDYGIELCSCASEISLEIYGIKPNRCIDNQLIGQIADSIIPYRKDNNQRDTCQCHESVDIGEYKTCKYDCVYCYAQ